MAPDNRSSVRFTPAPAALAGLSKDECRRYFYQTHTSSVYQGEANPEDAKCENFRDIHIVGQRDSKYMKYQYKRAPNWGRELCEHTREYHAHDQSDHAVTGELADLIKDKQGVGRPTVHPKFVANTKYHDDFRGFSRNETKRALRQPYTPVIPCDKKGRPCHPMRGTDRLEETTSTNQKIYIPHPLDLAKTEKALIPKGNLGPAVDPLPQFMPHSTAYREDFHSEEGVARRPLRKPIRCKSAPALRGPVAAFPNWMRKAVAAQLETGEGWAASRVTPQMPVARARPASAVPSASRSIASALAPPPPGPPAKQSRARPASAGSIGNSTALDRRRAARPPSELARLEATSAPRMPMAAATRERPQRPASAGGLRSSSSLASRAAFA